MIVYWLIFSNIITANQFVVERYIFIPMLGFCILLSHLLQGYPYILTFLVGLYMSKTLCHLWTYKSQKHFYLSNFLNFENSEVSLGNLGVCLINEGKIGSAIDVWQESAKINPFYDVAWYNLFSVFRSNGLLLEAKGFLEKCLNAKTVHFKDGWQKEYEELCKVIDKKTQEAIAQQQAQQPPIIIPPQK